MEMTTFTSLRIPYRAAKKEERSKRGPTQTSVNRPASPLLPLPLTPDAILFKSFYIRWPQSTPPHRPPSLLQRRGHHSVLARLLPECTLLSSPISHLPSPCSLLTFSLLFVVFTPCSFCVLLFLFGLAVLILDGSAARIENREF